MREKVLVIMDRDTLAWLQLSPHGIDVQEFDVHAAARDTIHKANSSSAPKSAARVVKYKPTGFVSLRRRPTNGESPQIRDGYDALVKHMHDTKSTTVMRREASRIVGEGIHRDAGQGSFVVFELLERGYLKFSDTAGSTINTQEK